MSTFEPLDTYILKLATRAGIEAEAISDALSGNGAGDDDDPATIAGVALNHAVKTRDLILVGANEPHTNTLRLPVDAIFELAQILRSLPANPVRR
jgi:hypothetical protein